MKKEKKSFLKKILRKINSEETHPLFISPSFLLPEEKIIFKTHPHWLCIIVPEVVLAVLGIILLRFIPFIFPPEFYQFMSWYMVLFGGAWIFVMIVIFLYWICINYYLTNLRLVEERGIIGKRIISIWLDDVEDVTCKFGILGRIFGFGDIEIESAGTEGKIVFSFLPSPRKLRRDIEKAISVIH